MVAVPELCAAGPAAVERRAVPARCHRMVAIAGTARELLRPESDLLRIVSGVPRVDLLIAVEDRAPGAPAGATVDELAAADDLDDCSEEEEEVDELAAEVAALGLPGLRVHRMALREPLDARVEPDLVAGLSELVGFDPEPGVYCLAPAPSPADAERAVLDAATRRIAQVYGLPLVRYRCLELAVVPDARTSG